MIADLSALATASRDEFGTLTGQRGRKGKVRA